jgi:hypothetical protein
MRTLPMRTGRLPPQPPPAAGCPPVRDPVPTFPRARSPMCAPLSPAGPGSAVATRCASGPRPAHGARVASGCTRHTRLSWGELSSGGAAPLMDWGCHRAEDSPRVPKELTGKCACCSRPVPGRRWRPDVRLAIAAGRMRPGRIGCPPCATAGGPQGENKKTGGIGGPPSVVGVVGAILCHGLESRVIE